MSAPVLRFASPRRQKLVGRCPGPDMLIAAATGQSVGLTAIDIAEGKWREQSNGALVYTKRLSIYFLVSTASEVVKSAGLAGGFHEHSKQKEAREFTKNDQYEFVAKETPEGCHIFITNGKKQQGLSVSEYLATCRCFGNCLTETSPWCFMYKHFYIKPLIIVAAVALVDVLSRIRRLILRRLRRMKPLNEAYPDVAEFLQAHAAACADANLGREEVSRPQQRFLVFVKSFQIVCILPLLICDKIL